MVGARALDAVSTSAMRGHTCSRIAPIPAGATCCWRHCRQRFCVARAAPQGHCARAGYGPAGAGRCDRRGLLSARRHHLAPGRDAAGRSHRDRDHRSRRRGRLAVPGLASAARTRARSCRCRESACVFRRSAFARPRRRARRSAEIVVRYGEMLLIQVQQTAACNALHAVEARLSRWLLQARDRARQQHHQSDPRIPVADARRAADHRDGRRQHAAAGRAHPLSSRPDRDRGPAGARSESLRVLRGDPAQIDRFRSRN